MRSGIKHKKPYYLAEHMNFILPFTKVRSFPDDKMKYYSDIVKTLDSADNIIYVDSNDDVEDNESKYDIDLGASYPDHDYDIEDSLQNEGILMMVVHWKIQCSLVTNLKFLIFRR